MRSREAFTTAWMPVAIVAACFLLAGAVAFAWWVLLPESETVELRIPAGTHAALERGEPVDVIPSSVAVRRGDVLVIYNDDSTAHRLGTQWLPPGVATPIYDVRALGSSTQVVCSFHAGGSIGLSTLARPGIAHVAIPTLLGAIPLSIVALVGFWVARGLDEEDEVPRGGGLGDRPGPTEGMPAEPQRGS